MLFSANRTKQYRHSDFADYYVYSVVEKSTIPLAEDQHGGKDQDRDISNIVLLLASNSVTRPRCTRKYSRRKFSATVQGKWICL